MSDLMLIGVLRMPMDDPDPLDVFQYVSRGRQAADRIEADAAEIAALRAEVAGLREDAERYRWLRGDARATSEHWGGRWSLVVEGPAPGGNAPPASIDAAIDAARKGTT